MWHGGGMGMGHGGLDDDDSGQIYNHEVIKRLFPYFKSRLGLFTLSMVMMLVYTSTLVLIPWLIGYTIDNYVLSGDLSGLNRVGLVLIGVITANLVGNYLYMRLLGKISQEVLYKLRTDMFNHLQKLSVPFFDRNEVGRIMSRVMSDVGQLQEFLPMVTITLGDMLSLVGIIIVMFLMNWQLALVTIVVLPLLALIMGVWQRYARVAFIRIRYAISVVNTRLQQNISGVRVVQSMNREDLNLHQFDRVNMDHLDANLRAIRLSEGFYLGVKEVGNAEFRQFDPEHDSGAFSSESLDDDGQPVVRVTWERVAQFMNWLSIKDSLQPVYEEADGAWRPVRPLRNGYRLPTEAEWAWAARFAGREEPLIFAWGAALPPPDRVGNYADISARQLLPTTLVTYNDGFSVAAPSGSFPANALGIFDLGGNVSEWVQDFYQVGRTETETVAEDPLGPETGRFHVVRGPSWRGATVTNLRMASRNFSAEGDERIGFRIARNLE